jgi:general stress protein 26
MKTELKFDEVKEEKVRLLEQNEHAVLATSLNNRVTARTVTYISEGLTIIFYTLTSLKKFAQIKANSKVALCLENASIEGIAEILGSPQKEENKRLLEIFKKKFGEDWFDWFNSNYPELSVFVKVTPTLIESYVSKDDKPALEYLDLHNKRAYITTQWEKQEY